MKQKTLSLFFALGALVSLGCLVVHLGSPSTRENAFVAGLSGPRLAAAALLLTTGGIFCVFWVLSVFRGGWAQRVGQALDRRLERPDNLLAVGFLSGLTALILPLLALAGAAAGFGQVIRRGAETLAWAEGLALLALGTLAFTYRQVYRQPDFFDGAVGKIARVLIRQRAGLWIGAALLAAVAAVLIPSSSISMARVPGHDSGIFLYFGEQILRGQVPFRDLWDHKPPMIFYMDALGLLLGRGSAWGVWALEYLALATSALLGQRFLRRYFGIFPAGLAMLLSLGGIVFLLEGGNLTEEFSLPLQWGALALFASTVARGWEGRGGAGRALALGVLFSLALNFKQTMVGIWLVLFVYLVLAWVARSGSSPWKPLAWAGLGAAVTQGAIMAYFAAKHSLGEYWRVAFVYNLVYSDISLDQRVSALADLWDSLTHTSPLFGLSMLLWIGAGIWTARGAARREPGWLSLPLVVAVLDLPLELALISTSGKNYRHYFLTLIPAVTILTAWGVQQGLRLGRKTPGLATAGVLLAAGLALAPTVGQLAVLSRPASEMTITHTVALIQQETEPQDTVLLWGSQTVVNYLSGRAAPTRFVHQKPLFRAGFASRALSEEMLRDLQRRRPKLIINTHLPSTPFVTLGAGDRCQAPTDPPEGMAAVFEFICANYRFAGEISKDRWEVYRLRE